MFFLRSFSILAPTFRPMIHLDLTFVSKERVHVLVWMYVFMSLFFYSFIHLCIWLKIVWALLIKMIILSHCPSWYLSVQFSGSVMSDSLQPMNCSTPGLPVHHQLPQFTQTHVHCVGDAFQSFHPLLSPSPPALNLSQDQGLFQWVSSLHQVAKVLEFQPQHQSFQWTPRTGLL